MGSAAMPLPPGAKLVQGSSGFALPPGAKLVSGSQPKEKGFFQSFVDTINPLPAIGEFVAGKDPQDGKLKGPVQGAINLVSNAVDAGKAEFGRAVDAAKGEGEFSGMSPLQRASSALGHGAAAAIPLLGPAAAHAGDSIGEGKTAEGLGEAAGLVTGVIAPHAISKAAPAAVRAIAPGAEGALRTSAEQGYSRALNPTKIGNKIRTAQIVPELIDRGVTAMSLKGLQSQAEAHLNAVGSAIGDTYDNLPDGTSSELGPIFDHLQSAIEDTHSVTSASGGLVPKGPEAGRAIANIQKLQETLVDVAEQDPATGKLVVPVEKLRDLRQYFDRVAKQAGRYDGKALADQSTAEAHGLAADAIRRELAKDHPDIAALNKEYSFWKDVNQVVSDTIQRKGGQAPSVSSRAARLAGFLKGGAIGSELLGKLTEVVQSPAWRTASAVVKDRLADALATGNGQAAGFYVERIGQAANAAAVSGHEQHTPQIVEGQP